MNDDNEDSQELPPGLVGLQNLGNTCYMNGALQALSNCQQLTRFVLDRPQSLSAKSKGLSYSYSELMRQIWDKRVSNCAVPTNIIRNIKCIYPAFRGCSQQDTQEFLRCFLEQLHDELKEPIKRTPKDLLIDHDDQQTNLDISSPLASEEGDLVDDNSRQKCTDQSSVTRDSSILSNDISNETNDLIGNSSTRTIASSDIEQDGGNSSSDNRKIATANSNQLHSREDDQRSIISDTFEFKISSSVVCSSCNNVSTTIESFKDLSIPIPSRDHPYYENLLSRDDNSEKNSEGQAITDDMVDQSSDISSEYESDPKTRKKQRKRRKRKLITRAKSDDHNEHDSHQLQTYNNYPLLLVKWFWGWFGYFRHWLWGPAVTLDDCLSIFFGTDPLEGDNEYSCEVCTKKNKGIKYLKILQLPEVLCIHFKRYESISSSKITTHVSFPLQGLDLSPYMCQDAKAQCTTYKLIACICHHGSALLTGHYTTYALNCYDDQWYEFDDQYVTNVDESQVENSEAYILFYQKASQGDLIPRQRLKANQLMKKSSSSSAKKYFISKQWINKFNTFVEPGPISNGDFLCTHGRVLKSKHNYVDQLCHPISESVWEYLFGLHGGGPICQDLQVCDKCE